MSSRFWVLAALAAALVCGPAAAEEAPARTMHFGRFAAIEGRTIHFEIKNGPTADWTVAEDAPITASKKPTTLEAISPGDWGRVYVSTDGVIREIQMTGMKNSPWPKRAAAQAPPEAPSAPASSTTASDDQAAAAAEPDAQGKLVHLGDVMTVAINDGKTLRLEKKTEHSTTANVFTIGAGRRKDIPPDLAVLRGSARGTLADLQVGEKVRVLWNVLKIRPIHIEVVQE